MKALLDRGLEALTAPTESGLGGAVLAGAAALASLAVLGVMVDQETGIPYLRPHLATGPKSVYWQRRRPRTPPHDEPFMDDALVERFVSWARSNNLRAPMGRLSSWEPGERMVFADWLLDQGPEFEDDALWLQLEEERKPYVIVSPVVRAPRAPVVVDDYGNVAFSADQRALFNEFRYEDPSVREIAESDQDGIPDYVLEQAQRALHNIERGSSHGSFNRKPDECGWSRDQHAHLHEVQDLCDRANTYARAGFDDEQRPPPPPAEQVWFHGFGVPVPPLAATRSPAADPRHLGLVGPRVVSRGNVFATEVGLRAAKKCFAAAGLSEDTALHPTDPTWWVDQWTESGRRWVGGHENSVMEQRADQRPRWIAVCEGRNARLTPKESK